MLRTSQNLRTIKHYYAGTTGTHSELSKPMPSSENYDRNYEQEYASQKKRGESGTGSDSGSAKRHRLRRVLLKKKKVKPGQDVDHIKPLSKGGANTPSNGRATSPSKNRSFKRNPDGSMK